MPTICRSGCCAAATNWWAMTATRRLSNGWRGKERPVPIRWPRSPNSSNHPELSG